MNNKELSELLFPHIDKTIADYELMYPSRWEWHITGRFSPSPTGMLHIGGVYTSLVAQKFCKQHWWTFYLRIEDTDTARTVEWAIDDIISHFNYLGINIDEGPLWPDWHDIWNYWPYKQSDRKDIYHACIKRLVAEWKAYPCWMTPEEMDSIRTEQMALKKAPWIYGNYSFWRDKTADDYATQLAKEPESFVIRYRSNGKIWEKVLFDDINRWKIHMAENANDHVIMKSGDKLPTYHLAHAVDDHFMRTTHVIRWEEWLTSVPFHLQLFDALGFEKPQYVHLPSILKSEDGKKRKLSKRKDPEADIDFFFSHWYPKQWIINFILSLVDSKYETWLEQNPDKNYSNFEIKLEDMNNSGALMDNMKLNHICNLYMSSLSNEHLYAETLERADKYKPYLAKLMVEHKDYSITAIGIERLTDKDPKRFTRFDDIESQLLFFYDSEFEKLKNTKPDAPESIDTTTMSAFVDEYETILDFSMDTMEWFTQLKDIAKKYWFAWNNAEFKEWGYKWRIGDIAMRMRIQLACATSTPDLFSMMKVMGKERVFGRLRDM